MENPKIRIESDGIITKVYYMGEEIKACTSVGFSHEVGDKPSCLITQNALSPDYKPSLNNELL
jgi:hypothetical protein